MIHIYIYIVRVLLDKMHLSDYASKDASRKIKNWQTHVFVPGPMRRSCGSTERPIHLSKRIRDSDGSEDRKEPHPVGTHMRNLH